MDRIAPTRRPEGPPQGYHQWRSLLFAHWEVPLDVLRPLVPSRLSLDTFEGRAFVGLVPFTMRGIRPRWLPAVPGFSAFHETNVRTYVHLDGEDPGVWFFSLDAANAAAVLGARVGWSLPYFLAEMELDHRGSSIRYSSRRVMPGPVPADLSARWTIGDELGAAQPGTLEHFLCERYFLYARRGDRLLRGQVHHTPYPLRSATLESLSQSLLPAAGFPVRGAPMNVLYSPGVDVEVFPLTEVAEDADAPEGGSA